MAKEYDFPLRNLTVSQTRVKELDEAQNNLFHLISPAEVPQKLVYIRDA